MSVAHCYPSQIGSRGRLSSPLIARSRERRLLGIAAMAAGGALTLFLILPADVNAGSDAMQSATLRASIDPAPAEPAPLARKPVRVIPIDRTGERSGS
jgi:hypothetical protein